MPAAKRSPVATRSVGRKRARAEQNDAATMAGKPAKRRNARQAITQRDSIKPQLNKKQQNQQQQHQKQQQQQKKTPDNAVPRRRVIRIGALEPDPLFAHAPVDDSAGAIGVASIGAADSGSQQRVPAPKQPPSSRRVDYITAANPCGKRRVVGAPKRNRKEQMDVLDQVRAGNRMARAFGVDMPGTDDNEEHDVDDDGNHGRDGPHSDVAGETDPAALPLADQFCVEGDTTSAAEDDQNVYNGQTQRQQQQRQEEEQADNVDWFDLQRRRRSARSSDGGGQGQGDNAAAFLRSLKKKPRTGPPPAHVPLVAQRSVAQHVRDGDARQQAAAGAAVTKLTTSADLKPRNYAAWDSTREHPDDMHEQFVQTNADLFHAACCEYAERLRGSLDDDDERQAAARAHFAACGFGQSVVAMEDFDVTRATNPNDEVAAADTGGGRNVCCYPQSSTLRCRYDHHTFDGVPVLLPLRYHKPPLNLLEVVSNVVFCSFACALAFIDRESPRMHGGVKGERRAMLQFMARKWFGVTERLQPAPFIEQHCDYGGRLSTEQFRALSRTHYSFVQYPLAAAVPARYVTVVRIAKKLDRAKRQGLHLRVDEQHDNAVPRDPPKGLVIDPSAPAAPRGQAARDAAARARAARAADGGHKVRVATNEDGEKVTVDKTYIEKMIQQTAERHRARPKKKHTLQTMMNIREVTVDDLGS